jgi:leader peptidase (prepilin peptidase)/N-methyltransferase
VTGPAFAGAAAVLGLFVGSFLNVCIYRLPLGRTVLWGRSHCPHCDRRIRAWENVPVLSWLLLRGRCAGCRARIPLQYPVVEIVTAAVFAGGAWLYGPTPLLAVRLLFACAMIVLFTIDLQHRILPNVITLPGIVAGLAFSLFLPPGLRDALIGAIACSVLLFGMGEAVSRVLGKEALGFGDVKMIAMMGAFLGWQLTLVALFLASFAGSLIGVGLVAVTRNRDYEIPLGSFLALGALAAAAAGQPLMDWYVGLMFSGGPP